MKKGFNIFKHSYKWMGIIGAIKWAFITVPKLDLADSQGLCLIHGATLDRNNGYREVTNLALKAIN